jgi:hypothetical protein
MVFPNALGRSYVAQAPITDQEFTMNWMIEISESKGATSDVTMIPTPGVQSFAMVTKVGWRGLFEMNGRCFGVAQDGLYEITYPAQVGTATLLGTVALDTNPVTFSTNGSGGDQLFITSGGNGYCLDLSSLVLTTITNLIGKATQGGYLQGYFLAFDVNTSTVYYSDLLDGLTWDPTNYFQRTNQPDDWKAMQVTTWGYICLPGQYSGEMWYPNGGFPLPFAPDPAGNFNKGIAATFSIANAGGSVVWLSVNNDGDYEVVQATGLQPSRISDFALEYQLSEFVKTAIITDGIGESMRMNGHTLYRLTLPRANVTKQFDFTNGLWTDVGTWIAEDSEFTYFRPVFYAFAFDKHLIGDRETGTLYDMDTDYTTDVDDRVIRRVRRTPSVVSEQDYVFHRKLTILMKTGDAPISGQGSDPQLMLRYSDDGGTTWGNEIDCSVGEMGQSSALVWFWQLGQARNRVYELSCTDPIPWRVTQVFLDAVPASKRAA